MYVCACVRVRVCHMLLLLMLLMLLMTKRRGINQLAIPRYNALLPSVIIAS